MVAMFVKPCISRLWTYNRPVTLYTKRYSFRKLIPRLWKYLGYTKMGDLPQHIYERLHPEAKRIQDIMVKLGRPPMSDMSPVEAREMMRNTYRFMCGKYDFKGTRTERFVPSVNSKDGIPVFIYQPSKKRDDVPIIVYFHGGGMVIGDRDGVDITCKKLCDEGNFILVNVEYRLAPEHKFPAMFDDAEEVCKWTLANKISLGGSLKSKVGVGGDSAGGTLASAMAHDIDGLSFQVLVYPHVTGMDHSLPSFKEFGTGPFLDDALIEWFGKHQYTEALVENSTRMATMFRKTFKHIPPTLFIGAEIDPIRDECEAYATILRKHGVRAEVTMVKGATHNFFICPGAYPELTSQAYSRVCEFVNTLDKAHSASKY